MPEQDSDTKAAGTMAVAAELTGWDITLSNVADAAEEGSRITVSGETNSQRGFSDTEWEYSGTITDVGDYEVRFDGDGDHDYYLKKSGVDVNLCRVLENKGDYTFSNIDRIVIYE